MYFLNATFSMFECNQMKITWGENSIVQNTGTSIQKNRNASLSLSLNLYFNEIMIYRIKIFFIYDSILFRHTYHLLNFNLIDVDLFDTQIAHPIYEVEEKK